MPDYYDELAKKLELRDDVIDLLLLGACEGSLINAFRGAYGYDGTGYSFTELEAAQRVETAAHFALARLREADDYEEDEDDEDYYIEAMLEAAQRLIEGRLTL